MVTITYILAAVVLLGLCIFIHELGHLLGGRMVGIRAEIFSIGYGKGVLKKKIGDTTYQLTLIPFGGYCKFYGDEPGESRTGESYEFLSAHPLRRIVTVVMGPLFNLFFGIVLFFIMNLVGYPVESSRIAIPDFFKSGAYVAPAHTAGLMTGDRIVEISGKRITGFSDIQSNVVFSKGEPLDVAVERDGKLLRFPVTPSRVSENDYFTIGVMPYGERVLVVDSLENEAAARAGIEKLDEVKALDGVPVKTPADFVAYIRSHPEKRVVVSLVRRGKSMDVTVAPRYREELALAGFEDGRFKGTSIEFSITDPDKIKIIKAAIGAKKVRVNDRTVSTYDEFLSVLAQNRGKRVRIHNGSAEYSASVEYKKYGFIGVETAIAPEMVTVRHSLPMAAARAIVDPVDFIVMNLKGLGMLITGKLDVRKNLSGPVRIAKIAGDTAHYRGISSFIILMAKISIILMVMNLLPIPVVDGSHIIFYLIEMIKGSPINEKVMEKIQFVGVALLIMLGVFVVFNDLSFFPFFQKLFN